jgi:beta-phosphoglucomutase-like phosphatase (HAD superfamily)
MTMPYQAVLVDVDGTLVDSNAAHAHAWVEALAASGRRVDFLRVRPLVGMGSDKVLPALALVDNYLLSPFKRPLALSR